jgi:hypothetical protein
MRTLMHGEIAPVAEHDRVRVFALAVVADGALGVFVGQVGVFRGDALDLWCGRDQYKRNDGRDERFSGQGERWTSLFVGKGCSPNSRSMDLRFGRRAVPALQ